MEPVKIPIEDFIDLHTFRPEEISGLLSEYFSECQKNGLLTVRIIHGKGHGILKKPSRENIAKKPIRGIIQRCPDRSRRLGCHHSRAKKGCRVMGLISSILAHFCWVNFDCNLIWNTL